MRERLRRLPRRGVIIALIAFANALAWGLITPPFQVPDEPAHFYYASYLSETGKLPHTPASNPSLPAGASWYSPYENALLGGGQFYLVIGNPRNRPPAGEWARRYQAGLARRNLDRRGVGDASSATSNPPLYYLAQAAVDRVSPWRAPPDRLMAMRVLSALMGGLTVLCIFLFLREALPGSPWAWTVGAIAAALEPMFGFITGGVNNDAALYLASAALLLAIARLLRRGFSPGRLAAAGVLLVLGGLVKTQALAFAPAVLLAATVAWRRSGARSPVDALRGAGALVGAAAAPLIVYFALGHTVWRRPLVDRVGELASATPKPFSWRELISYGWQLYLPRPPFLTTLFPGDAPYDLWFKGLVGRFGWLDYGFPSWVYLALLPCAVLVGVLAIAALVAGRGRVRRRLGDLITYVVFAAGLAGAVALAGYRSRVLAGVPFEQARYLLPLLPLMAGVIALAVRGGGRRFGSLVGAATIVVVLALDVFAQLLTINRYYG